MKKFKQFIEMASAKQIKKTDLLNATSGKEALKMIHAMNPVQLGLGEGWYSVVFGDAGPLVIKISDSAIDGTYYYLELAKKNWIKNSCYPRIAVLEPFSNGPGYLAIMEKLNFDLSTTRHVWKVADWYGMESDLAYRDLSMYAMEHFDGSDNETYNKFKAILPKMDALFNDLFNDPLTATSIRENPDIHAGNVANRDGKTPVLVDPIGDDIGSEYNPNPHWEDRDDY